MKIAVVKHDPKDKALFDVTGKDSKLFFDSGADTLVVSPTRTTLFKHSSSDLNEILGMLGEFELAIVEGLKNWDLPRISLFREGFDDSYLDVSDAVALSESVRLSGVVVPSGFSQFDINDTDSICDWILKNAKDVSWTKY